MTISTKLFVTSQSTVAHPNTTTLDAKIKILRHYNIPQYIYTYKNNIFKIYNMNMKLLKTYKYKEAIDFCFSSCGSYLFILKQYSVEIYGKDLLSIIKGNFEGFKMKYEGNLFILIGNFYIYLFKVNPNDCIDIFEIENFDSEVKFECVDKIKGHELVFNSKFMVHCENNMVYIKDYMDIMGNAPAKQILCDTLMSKVYCLEDEKIVVVSLEGKAITYINVKGKFMQFSFCERYLYVVKEMEIFVYDTRFNNLINTLDFKSEISGLETCVEGIPGEQIDLIEIKLPKQP